MEETQSLIEPVNDPESKMETAQLNTGPTSARGKLDVKKFNRQLTIIISLTFKFIGVTVAVLLIAALIRDLSYDGYSLQEVQVPEQWEKAGVNADVIAAKVKAHILEIKDRVEHSRMNRWDLTDEKSMTHHVLENSSSELELSLSGIGISWNSILNLIRNSLGISRVKKINVFTMLVNGKAKHSIFIQNHKPIDFEVNVDSLGLFNSIDYIANRTAESILKIDNVELLAYYYSYGKRTQEELDEAIDLASYGLKSDPDTSRHKYYEHIWAWALNDKGMHAEAYERAKAAMQHKGNFISAYTTAADALKELKQYENSRKIFKQALKMVKEIRNDKSVFLQYSCYLRIVDTYLLQAKNDTSYSIPEDTLAHFKRETIRSVLKTKDKRESAFALDNIGYRYLELGVYDSAYVYALRAIKIDSTLSTPYYTITEIYGLQGDRQRFYLYFEKALSKTPSEFLTAKDFAISTAPYSVYKNEERFKNLWAKYVK